MPPVSERALRKFRRRGRPGPKPELSQEGVPRTAQRFLPVAELPEKPDIVPRSRSATDAGRAGMRFVGVIAIILFAGGAKAASITVEPGKDSDVALVAVVGDLNLGDEDAFRIKTSGLRKALVTFASEGGSAIAGIKIGETIRLRGYSTVVLRGKRCASACAVAWLGGSPRMMEKGAAIGFHAAYDDAGVSGPGNALVGAFLSEIGLSENAIYYITKAKPEGMTWLSLSDARAVGIDVELSSPQRAPNPALAGPRELPQPGGHTELTEPQSPASSLPATGRAAMLIAAPDNPQQPVVNLGSTVWSTISAAPGRPATVAVKADADIPDLKMHATMTLRKNNDPTLEASHTIDLKFTFADGAPITGFKDVGLPQMRKPIRPHRRR